MTRPRNGIRSEEGSATAELVILTPLLILFLLLVVAFGRLAGARGDVDGAAAQAARAASIARDPTAAAAATQTAQATLGSEHVTCAHLAVAVDTTSFTPGGNVAVTVTCTVNLSDLTGLHLPASETIAERFVEPIDRYRSATP
ncbi:MAG: TadE/TadG family type IV pilus assembly protein [Acidimicrobiales bacterium]